MPVETVGFMLKPCSFFTWNPTLDLPPDTNKASREFREDNKPCRSDNNTNNLQLQGACGLMASKGVTAPPPPATTTPRPRL